MRDRESSNNKVKIRGHMGGPGGRGIEAAPEKAKNFKGTTKKLLTYLSPFKIHFIFVFIFAIGGTIFSIVGPKILGNLTTKIFEGVIEKVTGVKGGGIDFDYIKNIIFILLSLYIASAVFTFIQGFIVTGVAPQVSYNLRD